MGVNRAPTESAPLQQVITLDPNTTAFAGETLAKLTKKSLMCKHDRL